MAEIYPWQASVRSSLLAAIEARQLPHGLLISGYPGWGSGELGAWLATRLLGIDVERDPRQVAHPDLYWLRPEARAAIAVAGVRDLREFIIGRPQSADLKVAVIETADRITISAANALLKTLEEPPGNSCVILTSERPGALPATIRSRCQHLRIPRDPEAARAWLDDPEAEALLADYDGAPLLARAGAANGETPMPTLLADLAGSGPAEQAARKALSDLDAAQLCARWLRCLTRSLAAPGEGAGPSPGLDRAAFAFVDELLWFHFQVQLSGSANVPLLLDRLCFLWKRLMNRRSRG